VYRDCGGIGTAAAAAVVAASADEGDEMVAVVVVVIAVAMDRKDSMASRRDRCNFALLVLNTCLLLYSSLLMLLLSCSLMPWMLVKSSS